MNQRKPELHPDQIIDVSITRRSLLSYAGLAGAAGAMPFVFSDTSSFAADGPALPIDVNEDFGSLSQRANVLVAQLRKGLTYFGQPRDYVTRLSYTYYQQAVKSLQVLLKQIEDTRDKYDTEGDLIAAKVSALEEAASHSKALQSQQEQELRAAGPIVKQLQELASSLVDQIASARSEVLASQERFNLAIQQASGGCSLGQVVSVIAAVASIATGTAGALAAAGAAFKSFDENGITLDDKDPTITKIKLVNGDVKKIGQAYSEIKENLASQPDSARLAIDTNDLAQLKRDFEKEIDNAPVDGAQKADFRAAFIRYCDLVLARNNKLLEIDQWLIRINQLESELLQRQNEQDLLQSQIAGAQKPDLQIYRELLDQVTNKSLGLVRNLLWQETRAFELWTVSRVKPDQFPLVGATGADLATTQVALDAAFITYLSGADEPQPFNPPLRWSLKLTKDQAKSFASKKTLGFTLPIEDFDNDWSMVFVTSIDVDVPGVDNFKGKIIQLGRNVFRSQARELIEFRTLPMVRALQAKHSQAITIAQEQGKYLGISPFSDWLLVADPKLAANKLQNVREIAFVFDGTFRVLL